jgi:NodT family efflux transporter outer membrane factor (OMF) lipoprotein
MSHHIENPESEPKCPAILFRIGIAMCCVLAVLAFAGGCSFAPKYNVPKVATPEAFKETNNWKMAEPKDATLRGNWWEMFGDAELNKYESQVCISNQNIAAGFANFMAARAVVREARSQYFPTVSANPSVVHSHQPTSVSSGIATGGTTTGGGTGGTVVTTGSTRNSDTTIYSLPFDATWEPDLWGAVRNTVKADAYNAQASAATLENLRLTAQADLAVDYYELRGQDELKQTYDSTVTAYEKSVKLTKTLFETGIDSEEDVASAETQLATVQAQASNVGIARAQYEHAIALLLGQPASTFSIPVNPLKANPPAIPVGLPSQLLERRPDIAAAERAVAAANAQIGVARAAFFPTITLSGSAGFESTSLGNLISGPSAFWSFGAAAAQNLFDAGLRLATVAQYKAQYQSTVANYRQTVLTAFQQVEDNLAALRILSQENQQQGRAVSAAQRTLNLSTNRYQLGIDSYLNVIVAQTTLLNNEQTAVNIQIQEMTSSVQLILALGGGWNESELPPPKKVTSQQALNQQKRAAN